MSHTRRSTLALPALALPGVAVAAEPKPKRPLRILILGGTGFTGPHQVRYALARGHKLTLFNRGRRPKEWPAAVEELTGDRNTGDLKALEGRDWDVCIDNPTSLPFWVRDAGKVLKGRVKQYVFISTISVYAKNDTVEDESGPTAKYEGKDAYAERSINNGLYGPLKALCEQEARTQFGADNVTVIRPGLIVGPGDETDRFSYWPVRLAKGGEILCPPAADPVQFIDARDIAEWTIRMVEQGRSGTYNATGPDRPMTVRQMLDGIARGVKSKPTFVHATEAWLEAEKVNGWSDLPVWVPGGAGENRGFSRRIIKKAVDAGLTFRPLPLTAADTLAWFKAQPAERQAKPRAGLAPDREAALLAKWKARET